MSVIVISKGSYNHGSEVAEKIAQKLSYNSISRDILITTSKRFNISALRLTRAYECSPSFLEKFTFGRDKYIKFIKAAILNELAKDNMIYHGFAGHFFVSDISHVLKVRINADMTERITYMMKREKVSKEEAANLVKKVDEERTKWSLELYGIDTWDSRLYDLVVNIGKVTIDHAVDLICKTVKLKTFQPTIESQKKIQKLAREALSKAKDIENISPFFEPMRDSSLSKTCEIIDA
ncbi:AAA family ATPase [candidate division CSSED10-310 bacterium]|uniref:AAA family ATPase n=1 Tax=candidate division CSSED10-310 bacterium TaxID=2855610 RepID=A0ABV6YU30_UNCC1